MNKKPNRTKKNAAETTAADTTAPSAATAQAALPGIVSLCVLLTPPPLWKQGKPDTRPYYSVEIAGDDGRFYSTQYRVKEEAKARELAAKMAAERKIKLVERKPWAGPAPAKPSPAQADEPAPAHAAPEDNDSAPLPF